MQTSAVDSLVRSLELTLKAVKEQRVASIDEQLNQLSDAIKDVSIGRSEPTNQKNPSQQAATAENSTVQMHVASALFINLDTLASSVRASYGMLFTFNEQTHSMVLVAACGSRYARPGSISIPINRNGGGKHQTAEALVLDSGIALNIGNAYLENTFGTSIDDRYLARAMGGVTEAISKANIGDMNVTAASIANLTSAVTKQTRTTNLLIFPVFKPGSHNSEIIGLLELGNKVTDGSLLRGEQANPDSASSFTSDDECRASEASVVIANIMAKYPHDLASRHNHDHGLDARLAQMMSGIPPPQYSISASITSAMAGNQEEVSIPLSGQLGNAFHYFTAGPLRTSAVRTQQLVYRSQALKPTTKRSDLVTGAVPLVAGLLKDSNHFSPIDAETETDAVYKKVSSSQQPLMSPASSTPVATTPSPHEVVPREFHASLRQDEQTMPRLSGIGVVEVLESAIQMNESWRNAVALNIELDTEIRRLHEALRVSRREISRLQDMVSSTNGAFM